MTQRIGDYGEVKSGEYFAGALVRFNRFVKRGSTDPEVEEAGTTDLVIGVAEFDPRQNFLDGTARTGWAEYEPVPLKISGEAIVVAAENLAADDLVTMGANGTAAKYTRPTVSSSPAKAEVESVRDMDYKILGRVVKDADSGDLVKIELNIAGQ